MLSLRPIALIGSSSSLDRKCRRLALVTTALDRCTCLLSADKAAIDDEVDAGHETRGAARQEHAGAYHLVGGGHAAQRRVALEGLHLFGHFRSPVHGGQRVAGADSVDAYAS